MSNSSKRSTSRKAAKLKHPKPEKPYDGFPLGASSNGYWIKKIGGEIFRFGRWGKIVNGKMERLPDDGWQAALKLYNSEKDARFAGEEPEEQTGELTVVDACNHFLTSKQPKLKSGELTYRTFSEYRKTIESILARFGSKRLVKNLKPIDFQHLRADLAETNGPARLANEVQRVRSVFKYALENDLIEKAVTFGSEFRRPSKKIMRQHQNNKAKRFFEADEIRSLLDSASLQMRAMILLGINCAYGNTDVAGLKLSHVDMESGWINYPREKTGIPRRCPLWPETLQALQEVIDNRSEPKSADDAGILFITKPGNRWLRPIQEKRPLVDSVGTEFGKLVGALNLKKLGRSFYALRHTHRTISDGVGDPTAARIVMGHVDDSIDNVYVEHVDDERLQNVVDHVRQWLFSSPDDNGGTSDEESQEQTESGGVTIEYEDGGQTFKMRFPDTESATQFIQKMKEEKQSPKTKLNLIG